MAPRTKSASAVAALMAVSLLAACQGGGLTAESSCNEFLHATAEDQNAAVQAIAADLHAGNAVTPLGRPNIDYLCANSPDSTLGSVIQTTG